MANFWEDKRFLKAAQFATLVLLVVYYGTFNSTFTDGDEIAGLISLLAMRYFSKKEGTDV